MALAWAVRGALVVVGILNKCSKTGQLPTVIWHITGSDVRHSYLAQRLHMSGCLSGNARVQ